MGARVIRQRNSPSARRLGTWRETKALLIILASIGLPMLLAYVLVALDMRSDLSDLKAAQPSAFDSTLVGWADLTAYAGDRRARMIGYMMDGYRPASDGSAVTTFVLMPEAGQFLHPAHRIPDEMVEVRTSQPVPFRHRRLVWATGRLNRTVQGSDGDRAAYAMSDAVVESAVDREITEWFRPF